MPAFMKKPSSCPGESCPGCSSANCYAEGGNVKGVHKDSSDPKGGTSDAGSMMATHNWTEHPKISAEMLVGARNEHRRVLSEQKSMKKPNLYAEGGSVLDDTHRKDNEKGVHQKNMARQGQGVSQGGMHARLATDISSGKTEGYESDAEDHRFIAKKEHKKVLGEMKAMPKPKLYAEGGAVESGGDEMDEELHHAIGGELMDALERKDKKGIMEALKAAVMECMNGEHE